MQQINHDVRNVHSTTPWIEGAQHSVLALGLVYFVDEIADSVVKAKPDVIAVPSPDYMYATIHKPFLRELDALGQPYPTDALPIVVLYPAQETESLFLHLILAHELGHSAIQEHRLIELAATSHSDQAGLQARIGQAVTEFETIEARTNAESLVAVRGLITNWLAEVLCDALAVGFLGPSFLFTAVAFGTPFGGPIPTGSHPPHSLRTRLLLTYLSSWGWRPLLEAHVPRILQWLDETAATPIDASGKTYFETLEQAVEELGPTIEQVVENHLGDGLFSIETYEEQAEEIRGFLSEKVLPAQLLDRSPTDRRSTLLAGWLRAFAETGDEPSALPAVVADRDFQSFLSKALEMSAVLQRWEAIG
jgi:hypothetical protein